MARKGLKFYAVRVGRRPGVYTTWAEAKALVTNYSGAVHQSFPTRAEANRWLNASRSPSNTGNQQASTRRQASQRDSDYTAPQGSHPVGHDFQTDFDFTTPQGYYPPPPPRHRNQTSHQSSRPDPRPAAAPVARPNPDVLFSIVGRARSASTPDHDHPPRRQPSQNLHELQTRPDDPTLTEAPPAKRARLDPGAAAAATPTSSSGPSRTQTNEIAIVYTDGAAPGNGKTGATAGIGVYFGPDDPRNISARLPGPLQTNQRAELTAILYALEAFPPTASVDIRTDSQYSIDCVTKWYISWVRNGWRSSKGEAVKNDDIIKPIRDLIDRRDAAGATTKLTKVRGHSGDPGNDQADLLAVAGARLPHRRLIS